MKACREVEGLFLSRLLEAMDKPAFGDGILGNSNASTLFRARRNQAIADEMGRRGDIGLADMLYEDLSHSHDAATSDSESVSDQGGTER
jgi:Rod binding domain-containing protein